MKLVPLLPASCMVLSIFVCSSGQAQTDVQTKREAQNRDALPAVQPHYLKATEMVGTKVYTSATTEQLEADRPFSDVKDIIVNTNAAVGHGSFAVLSDGELFSLGSDSVYGVCSVKWAAGTRCFAVDSTPCATRTDGADALPAAKNAVEATAVHGERRMVRDESASVSGNAKAPRRLLMWSGLKGLRVCNVEHSKR